jgi:methylmalonyl-CoA mutase, N-terminal domain
VESGADVVVGVNKYTVKKEDPISTLKINFKAQRRQIERLKKVREGRDEQKVKSHLERLRRAYEKEDANSMYPLMDAVAAYATLGEIVDVGRQVFGTYREPQLI